jgi:hypothetical protein
MDFRLGISILSLGLGLFLFFLRERAVRLHRHVTTGGFILSVVLIVLGLTPLLLAGWDAMKRPESPELKLSWGEDGELDGRLIDIPYVGGIADIAFLFIPDPGIWLTATADTNVRIRFHFTARLAGLEESPDRQWASYTEMQRALQAGDRVRVHFPQLTAPYPPPSWIGSKLEVSRPNYPPLTKTFMLRITRPRP